MDIDFVGTVQELNQILHNTVNERPGFEGCHQYTYLRRSG